MPAIATNIYIYTSLLWELEDDEERDELSFSLFERDRGQSRGGSWLKNRATAVASSWREGGYVWYRLMSRRLISGYLLLALSQHKAELSS